MSSSESGSDRESSLDTDTDCSDGQHRHTTGSTKQATTRKAEQDSDSDSPDLKKIKLDDSSEDDPELELESVDLIELEETDAQQKEDYITKYEGDYNCEVLTPKDLMIKMADTIKELQIMELPENAIRQLLIHFKWDKDKLLDKYYEKGKKDGAELMKELGIVTAIESSTETKPVVAPEECKICFDIIPAGSLFSLKSCNHRFCIKCWCDYLKCQILDQGMSESIRCPEVKCASVVDTCTVYKLVKDDRIIEKYRQLLAKGYVESNRQMRWCFSPDCSNAISVDTIEAKPVKCSCGSCFCFSCGNNWHGPLRCNLLKKWKKKCDDDSETSNWIAAHTKDCPKCHTAIEKNGGCNHMTCRSVNCRYEFCWICLGDWKAHKDSYNCNSYNPQASTEKETSRRALERYLFYCNRYMNHMNSLKFENRLYKNAEAKRKELAADEDLKMSYLDTEIITQSVDILCRCRNTLMCTYAFAFYLEKTVPAIIFEDNQKDLEMATESLSEYLERDINTAEPDTIKAKLLHLKSYCERRRNVLVEHVYEGYEKDFWTYNEQYQTSTS